VQIYLTSKSPLIKVEPALVTLDVKNTS